MTNPEFEELQKIESGTWCIENDQDRWEKMTRERARYPLMVKQMGLKSCIDTSKMVVWDIGAGPCGGVSSVLPYKKRLRIDPNKEAYSEYYNVSDYDGTKAEDLQQRLSEPDLIVSTNCIDHFHNPERFLQDLNKYMKYGAYFCHFHAIDNAFQHPHPHINTTLMRI